MCVDVPMPQALAHGCGLLLGDGKIYGRNIYYIVAVYSFNYSCSNGSPLGVE